MRRLITRKSVDFPAPERPMTPVKLPRSIWNDASATAAVVPKFLEMRSATSMRSPPPLRMA